MEKETLTRARPLAGLANKELLADLKKVGKGMIDTPCHEEFYHRFIKRFHKVCYVICVKRHMETYVMDICHDAFIKAFRNIENFEFDIKATDESVGNKVLSYLGQIAFTSVIDLLRERVKEFYAERDVAASDACEDPEPFGEAEVENISAPKRILQEALDKLSDDQRYILMVYIDFGAVNIKMNDQENILNVDSDNDGTVKEVSFRKIRPIERKRICAELGITEGYLRILKMRAIRKVLSYIKKNI